ncbi:site-specific recombinase, phage integrase family [Streptococcus sp. oral taxon 056 str. F0418]|uniref:tyrosine-type recombinase/integrase n=1 Tax=Streptococcus sp. oral taxon 056 TaxID=712620 RepID=UPI00021805AF|nr:site-specific integrase [Streptococcus sp. oral taxon 056]EGP67468.1 site-specific recombinase, phage integrase family [Streptococcus sp. oral taxon 056 str. F0418]
MFFKVVGDKKVRYYEKYYDESEGKWKQVSCTLTSKTRAAQAEARKILEAKIEEKTDTIFGVSQDLLVSEIANEWLVIREAELKRNTYVRQKVIFDSFLQEFGTKKVSKIPNTLLQKYLLANDWSDGYRRLFKTVLDLFFTYCHKVGYIKDNPMERVVLPKVKNSVQIIQRKKEHYLSKEEMREYLSYLENSKEDKRFILLAEFLYLTGLRVGEALGLKWENVNIKNKEISIQHTLITEAGSKNYYLSSPKTVSSVRTIRVSDRVIEILSEYNQLEAELDGLVFIFRQKYPIPLITFNCFLRRTFERSKIDKGENFRLTSHVFRHSHISLLSELGVPLRAIMDRVGHSNEKMTLSIYTHVTQNMELETIDKLEKIDLHAP